MPSVKHGRSPKISIRLPRDVNEWLRKRAEARGRSLSETVRYIVERVMEDEEKTQAAGAASRKFLKTD